MRDNGRTGTSSLVVAAGLARVRCAGAHVRGTPDPKVVGSIRKRPTIRNHKDRSRSWGRSPGIPPRSSRVLRPPDGRGLQMAGSLPLLTGASRRCTMASRTPGGEPDARLRECPRTGRSCPGGLRAACAQVDQTVRCTSGLRRRLSRRMEPGPDRPHVR